MTSSFSGINTALSALRYNRVAMDVAGDNVANVNTEGYTRRRLEGASVAGPTRPAMWSRYDGVGDGVRVTGVNRLSDELINVRTRREYGTQAYLDVRKAALQRVENGVGEPGDQGLNAALASVRSAYHDLTNAPGSSAARAQVLSATNSVVEAVRAQAKNFGNEASDQRIAVLNDVREVNTVAGDLAGVNRAVAAGLANGGDVNVLLDRRDQLALRLSTLTGASVAVQADGTARASIGGLDLVVGSQAGALSVASGVTPTGDPDGSPLTFAVTPPGGSATTVAGGLGGELGGITDLVDVTIPGYLNGLTAVARSFADGQNAQLQAGYDQTGAPGGAMLAYNPADVLGTLTVAITDPARVAASSVPGGGLDAGNASTMASMPGVEDAYQRLITTFGSQVADSARKSSNQQVLTDQVDSARDQLGGVNLDEEMVNMLQSQRAYEAASRLMTTLDSVLETLINRTGVSG